MNVFTKIREFLLGANTSEEEESFVDEYEDDEYEEPVSYAEREKPSYYAERERRIHAPRFKKTDSNVVAMPSSADNKKDVRVFFPEEVEDAPFICDHLKKDVICVVNLENIDKGNAQRIADFLGGSSYTIGGSIERLSNSIFLIAPSGTVVSSELKKELRPGGHILPWISSAFK
ncbi:MAG: cell division protein SepF [Clostridiales bacterium]|jgi:cell division inhibitor SepF|nr:cell division protein SepF [Clostridiales bacterium]